MDIFGYLVLPFTWALKQLYVLTGNYGVAIIIFALVTKIVLLYFSARGKKGMMKQQRLLPKQQALQKQYEKDKAQYQQALQKLYQDEGVSMTGGCLWTLLPLIILIPLYTAIRTPMVNILNFPAGQYEHVVDLVAGSQPELVYTLADIEPAEGNANLTEAADKLKKDPYGELKLTSKLSEEAYKPAFEAVRAEFDQLESINYNFLGLDLSGTPGLNWLLIIPILSAASAFCAMMISTRMNKKAGIQQQQGKFMMLFSPALSLYFAFIMPALMGLYWISQNLFGIAQDYFLTKHYNKIFAAEDARRAELEARRKAAEDAMKEELRQRRAEAIAEKKKKRKPGQTIYKMQNKPKK